ncbi:MAG: pitrilysin family protein [Oscillospiraceae bacterium]|nr:pitrilysin family protein [Oscillospiraceae bacterium]
MEKKVFENGLRLIYLPIDKVRSASVAVWVATGSRHETLEQRGISHFIEHMLFKGTVNRSARDISEQMDMLGGGLNAYTAKEYTRYYAQTLGKNAVSALDILCDMLTNPLLDADELERERGVILDEMAMYEDSGEDVAHEALCSAVWPNSPLGQPICGVADTVSAFTPDDLRGYMRERYTPDKMIVVVAGDYDRSGVDELVKKTLGSLSRGKSTALDDSPVFTPSLALKNKKFEQTSLALAMPGLPSGDPRRYSMMLLNFIIGGGASSRLFQRLREELGLAYSVYSSHSANLGAGLFTVFASFSADKQALVLDEINRILEETARGVTNEEFERARAQVKASSIMGMETVAAQATFVGRSELFEGRLINFDQIIEKLDALTRDDVDSLAENILGNPARALSVAGKVKKRSYYMPFISHTKNK